MEFGELMDMPDMSEEQARNLLAEAGKLAKPGMLGFGGRKYDDAADACKRAANIYKMLKKGNVLLHRFFQLSVTIAHVGIYLSILLQCARSL